MDLIMIEAVNGAILSRKKIYSLCRCAAEWVSDTHTRQLFETIAQSAADELRQYLSLCPGSVLIEGAYVLRDSAEIFELSQANPDIHEKSEDSDENFLGVVLQEERNWYVKCSAMVESFREPHLNNFFRQLRSGAARRCRWIQKEFIRVAGCYSESMNQCVLQ